MCPGARLPAIFVFVPILIMSQFDLKAALDAASEGKTLRDIAEAMGCNYSQLNYYCKQNPQFKHDLDQAREQGWYLQADLLRTLTKDNPNADFQKLRLEADNIKWLLARMMPSIFGDRLEVKIERVDIAGALFEAKVRSRVIDAECTDPDLLPAPLHG